MSGTVPNCPITQQPLRNPWLDPEGNTFEYEAIVRWLSEHGTSPITRTAMTVAQLVPNRALKDLIDAANEQLQLQRPPLDTAGAAQQSAPALSAADVTVSWWQHPAATDSSSTTAVTITGPPTGPLQPCHICCVIDTSGSMCTEATIKTVGGGTESDGLTLLDIVKHATRTIIESLGSADKCSLVAFSSESRVVLQPTAMTTAGKQAALEALAQLEPDGSTNLAAGVRHGVQVSTGVGPGYISAVFVLTDGVPSDSSLDYAGALRRQLAKEQPLYGSVHTFGFGYSLDSQLLKSIAVEGDGAFAFIPDAGMVGTVFINALSNVRTVYASRVSVRVPKTTGALTVLGGCVRVVDDVAGEAWRIQLPPLRYGQPLTVVMAGAGISAGAIEVDAATLNNNRLCVKAQPAADSTCTEAQRFYHSTRAGVAQALFSAAATQAFSDVRPDAVLTPTPEFERLHKDFEPLDGLYKDLTGQVREALSKEEWFSRWGRHYLTSLAFAHLHQRCNNFKDPGVQAYGGQLFKQLQADLNDLFMALPAPTPTGNRHQSYSYGRGGPSAASAAAPVDMSRYNNSGGVCFHPDCSVQVVATIDGTEIITWLPIKDLRKGMRVTESGGTVSCIVETKLTSGAWFARLAPNVLVTPYHPVRRFDVQRGVSGEWMWPADCCAEDMVFLECDSVFNLVLDETDHPYISLECGFQAVTLGHGITTGVAHHPYFGTRRVVDDLATCDGWHQGHVQLAPESIVRQVTDVEPLGQVVGILSS